MSIYQNRSLAASTILEKKNWSDFFQRSHSESNEATAAEIYFTNAKLKLLQPTMQIRNQDHRNSTWVGKIALSSRRLLFFDYLNILARIDIQLSASSRKTCVENLRKQKKLHFFSCSVTKWSSGTKTYRMWSVFSHLHSRQFHSLVKCTVPLYRLKLH